MTIYQEIILYHYKHPHNFGELEDPDLTAFAVNTVCGDKIVMMIKSKKNKIVDVKFSGQGCAISIASGSMLTDFIKDKKIASLKKITAADMLKLLSIDLTPNRIKCTLLPLEALQKAVT